MKARLVLEIVEDDSLGDLDEKVEENYARVKAAEVVQNAEQLFEANKGKEADVVLNEFR